jgi:transposase-like protein
LGKFKAEVVPALLNGQRSSAGLCRESEPSPTLLAQWKETLHAAAAAASIHLDQRTEEAARIAEMECLVRRLTWENDTLK